jgi:hypothetical protein
VLLQHLTANNGSISVAIGIDADAFCAAVVIGGRLQILDERRHCAGLRAADPDAFLRAVLIGPPRFRIGNVDGVVPRDVDAARTAELFPLDEKLPVLVEDLDAVVDAVADEDASLRIERDGVRLVKFAWAGSFAAPGPDLSNLRIGGSVRPAQEAPKQRWITYTLPSGAGSTLVTCANFRPAGSCA